MYRRFLSGLILVAFLFLSLAVTQFAAAYEFPYTFKGKAVPDDQTLVFGKVKVIRGDEVITWSDSLFAASPLSTGVFYVFVLPAGTFTAKGYRLTKDGFFCWQLPPGTYILSGFKIGQASIYSGRVFATFKVPSTNAPLYIGTLKLVFRGGYDISVEDEYASAKERLNLDFPAIVREPEKALLELEGEP